MSGKKSNEELPLGLEALIDDERLARLFSEDAQSCALQLWILQLKIGQVKENRIVYGRLLPYDFSDNAWHSGEDDRFRTFGQVQAQVALVNLYVKGSYCAELLRKLSTGKSIATISDQLKLSMPGRLKERFGDTALPEKGLAYRPVAYLLNRDSYDDDRGSPCSPHGEAGALSASITQTDKVALFNVEEGYHPYMTEFVVQRLSDDTGLNFGGCDTVRFGDIELLTFPTLDDQERSLLTVSWNTDPEAVVIRFNAMQLPRFNYFLFRLSIANNAQIMFSRIVPAARDSEGIFEGQFPLDDLLRAATDSTELEIYGYHDNDYCASGTLCSRWKVGYIRELNVQGRVSEHGASPVKFDWLEKTTGRSGRVKAALTPDRGGIAFENRLGGREADPWVPANQEIRSLFARLHPPKSEGAFFLRWGKDDGESRLQFVEWFKALLAKYGQHQIVIFDPYFEIAGLVLIFLSAAPRSDYIVFTTLPKAPSGGTTGSDDSKTPASDRISNLISTCEKNRDLFKRIKLRIYGMKAERLHDRYILVIGSNGLPVAGFNLSNSFQSAAQNYPLLVTPIPRDTLLKVEKYQSDLVREANCAAGTECGMPNPETSILFDSSSLQSSPQRCEPLRFLERESAGHVLSMWAGEASLEGLHGDQLKQSMTELGLLESESLTLPETPGLTECVKKMEEEGSSFTESWEVLGEVLAHSRHGDGHFLEFAGQCKFLVFLSSFVEKAFDRTATGAEKEASLISSRFFRQSIESLLHSSYHPGHLFYPVKYPALSWPEYFGIKALWRSSPDRLLTVLETQIAHIPEEPDSSDMVRLSLLSQAISEIALSVDMGAGDDQIRRLARSSSGLLKWIGLNGIERRLDRPGGLDEVMRFLADLPDGEELKVLAWMTHRAAKKEGEVQTYADLVTTLHGKLPGAIPLETLMRLVDDLRGHMNKIAWAEPWLFQDVILPLLQDERANTEDACEIWIKELTEELKTERPGFSREREGQTTNIAAFLYAYSAPEQRESSLRTIEPILGRHRRIVQQPLASTSDWKRWDRALVVSMWILGFCRWAQYYLREREVTDDGLIRLSQSARDVAFIRPMEAWESEGIGKNVELAAFLDQVEGLMANEEEQIG